MDYQDTEEIILIAKFVSKVFKCSLKDIRKSTLLMENFFKLLTTNDHLDLLSCIIYFIFLENKDEDLEDMKIIISNIFIKILR